MPNQTSQAHFQIAGGQARQSPRITTLRTIGSFITWTRGHGLEIALEGFSKGSKAKAIASVGGAGSFRPLAHCGQGKSKGKKGDRGLEPTETEMSQVSSGAERSLQRH